MSNTSLRCLCHKIVAVGYNCGDSTKPAKVALSRVLLLLKHTSTRHTECGWDWTTSSSSWRYLMPIKNNAHRRLWRSIVSRSNVFCPNGLCSDLCLNRETLLFSWISASCPARASSDIGKQSYSESRALDWRVGLLQEGRVVMSSTCSCVLLLSPSAAPSCP